MEEFFIDKSTCNNCGVCAKVCPALCLEISPDKKVNFRTDTLHLCLGCGQCMAVCKTRSITSKGMSYEKDFFEFTDDNSFFSLLEERRSVRRFKPRAVSREEIDKILYAVSQAPHGDSHHHVEITVVNSREKLLEALPLMSKFYDDLVGWLKNPVISTVIRLKQGKDGMNTLRNHLLPRILKGVYKNYNYDYDGITRGAHTLLIFHADKCAEEHKEDSYIFVTYAMLAAQALGLGSTIIGLVPPAVNKLPQLKKLFNIPESNEAVTSIIIGYPKYKYYRGIKRELKGVHWVN